MQPSGLPGPKTCIPYGWRLADEPLERRLREASRCAVSLGRLLGHMHAVQVSHRDLKWANLLAVPGSDERAVYLVDLDGAKLGGPPSLRPARPTWDAWPLDLEPTAG